jgi:acyl carrier protein
MEIQEKVKEIIAEIAEIDSNGIKPDAHFINDLGIDSLNVLELVFTFEQEFKVVIDPSHFPEMTTIEKTATLLQKLIDGGK